MRRTPDAVSKARQKAGQEIKIWRAGIREACLDFSLSPEEQRAKISLCKAHLARCKKKIAETVSKGRKEFWAHDRPKHT